MPTYGKNGSTLNLEHLQLKFAAASSWVGTTVLLAGEVGVESDTHKFKVGDGSSTWTELPYSADPNVQTLVDGLTTRVSTAEGNITGLTTRMGTAEGNITALQTADTTHETRMGTIESKDTEQDGRLDALEAITAVSANPFSA